MSNELAQAVGIPELYIGESFYLRSFISDSNRPIVITFHYAADIPTYSQVLAGATPFGFEFFKNLHLNVLSISPLNYNDWYRSADLHLYLSSLVSKLKRFPEVIGYGSSMGGYAISTFSKLLNIHRVLLLNPISTLNKNLAPWENRYNGAAKDLDWHGDYHDGCSEKLNGFILFDPTQKEDAKHAKRFIGTTKVRVFGGAHNIPRLLLDAGLLKEIVILFYKDQLTLDRFNVLLKKVKDLEYYYTNIIFYGHMSPWRKKVLTYRLSNVRSVKSAGVYAYVPEKHLKVLEDQIKFLIDGGRLNLALNMISFALESTSYDPRFLELKNLVYKIHNERR